jgi:hypothetical protein
MGREREETGICNFKHFPGVIPLGSRYKGEGGGRTWSFSPTRYKFLATSLMVRNTWSAYIEH